MNQSPDSFDFRVNDGALDSQLARVSISSSASGNDTWLFTKNLDGTVLIDGCVGGLRL